MELSKLQDVLSVDCAKHSNTSFFDRCGIYFPGWKGTTTKF
jgi:predicted ATP-dependent Lon-type protease